MSSFVVSKEEYIKAAGMVAGIAEAKGNNYGVSDRFWIYDYVTGRNMTPEDYYRNFVECYDMNALSVQEQYHDNDRGRDDNEYLDTLNEYRAKAKRKAISPDALQDMILNLHGFFRCAEYQTENKGYYWKMITFFNRINEALLPLMAPARSVDGWGSLEL